MSNLLGELQTLLNRFSVENASNTPDLILAEYMMDALKAFEQATRRRDAWYGMNPVLGDEPAKHVERIEDVGYV